MSFLYIPRINAMFEISNDSKSGNKIKISIKFSFKKKGLQIHGGGKFCVNSSKYQTKSQIVEI